MKNYLLFCCLCILSLLAGCSGAKKYLKQGIAFEQSRMYLEAANSYMEAIRRNPRKIEAQMGLKRVGERVLDDYLSEVFQAHANGQHRETVYAFLKAQAFQQQVAQHSVQLRIPPTHRQYFEESKGIYLAQRYQEGTKKLLEEQFDEANNIFEEILSIDPNYKDVKKLKQTSTYEPIYREGNRLMNEEKYKQAFYKFDQIYRDLPDYKDVRQLREYCRRKAMLTVSVLPVIPGNYNNRPYAESLRGRIINRLVNNKHPLIEVVDRDNIDKFLNEQQLGMTGVVNEGTAAEAGKLLGAKAVLAARIINVSIEQTPLQAVNKIAYEAYKVKVTDTTTNKTVYEVRYRKTNYTEYQQSKTVEVSVQYYLISSETGKIIFSNIARQSSSDHIHYATYRGDYKNLYPGSDVGVNTSSSARKELHNLFTAKRQLNSTQGMLDPLLERIAEQCVNNVIHYVETEYEN